MKAVSINSRAWYVRLAEWSDYSVHSKEHQDICMLIRFILKSLISGAFMAAVALFISGVFFWFFGNFIGWLVFIVLNGWIPPTGGAGFVLALAGISLIVGTFYFSVKGTRTAIASTPALEAAWDSVHNKICVRLKINN